MTYSQYPISSKRQKGLEAIPTLSRDSFTNMKKWSLNEINNKLNILGDILPSLYNSDVRPVQCDHSIATINDFLKYIRNLNFSVESLPLELSKQTDKYKLSINLCSLEDQILALYSLIRTLRPICREEINKRGEIQSEIQEQFEIILELSEQLA